GPKVGLAGERVETVEHEAHSRVISAPDGLPGIAVVVDVLTPGQSLETDAQAALARPLPELVEVCCRPLDASEALRRHVGAHEQEIATQLLHDVELAFGAREQALALV